MSNHFVVVNEGAVKMLDDLIAAELDTCYLRLFKSTRTPSHTDVLADYTAIECTFPGYAAIQLTSWLAAAIVAGKAYTEASNQTFTRTSGGSGDTVYGYFLADTNGSSGKLLGAMLFDSTVNMTVNGNSFQLLATFDAVPEW